MIGEIQEYDIWINTNTLAPHLNELDYGHTKIHTYRSGVNLFYNEETYQKGRDPFSFKAENFTLYHIM